MGVAGATLQRKIHCVIYGFKSEESNYNRPLKPIATASHNLIEKDGIPWKLSIANLSVRL